MVIKEAISKIRLCRVEDCLLINKVVVTKDDEIELYMNNDDIIYIKYSYNNTGSSDSIVVLKKLKLNDEIIDYSNGGLCIAMLDLQSLSWIKTIINLVYNDYLILSRV